MSSTAQDLLKRHRLSVEEYHRMGEVGILNEDSRVELIEGEIVDMTPIGSNHAAAVKRLTGIFYRAVGESALVSVQDPISIDELSEPEPDIALLKPRTDFYASGHPRPEDILLLVEVADTSLRYDREIKIPLYARHGIPEVWLVDLENREISIFHSPEQETYQQIRPHPPKALLTPLRLPGISLDLSGLFPGS